MATARDRIASFLCGKLGQPFCDDCLSATLSIAPRQQVQQKTSRLVAELGFARRRGTCSQCRSEKVVIEHHSLGPASSLVQQPRRALPEKARTPSDVVQNVKSASENRVVVLISCVSMKRAEPSKARDLYVSPLFRLALAYAEALEPSTIYILSAKHGLVSLDQELSPYNDTLNTKGHVEIQQWARTTLQQLAARADLEHDQFVILAGERYRQHLIPHLRHYVIPMEGLGLGRQLAYLKEHVGDGKHL